MANNTNHSCYKVTKLYIEKFRRLINQKIELGAHVTLIAGQNGTSKSTLLGLIAFPFNFKSDEDSVYVKHYTEVDFPLESVKTLSGKPFTSDYSRIFRFSKTYDEPKEHKYRICIEGPDILAPATLRDSGIPVISRARKSKGRIVGFRLVAGKGHEKGQGKFPHPTIYLGLGRLAPLAECDKLVVQAASDDLSKEEIAWLHQQNTKILSLNEEPNGVEIIKSGLPGKGAFPAASYTEYNPETYSAGQDNLGQILISLLSFRRLKEKLGKLYAGGILFVDELDAALFPFAQQKLMDLLVQQSKELNLQIVATTHSLTMLHYKFSRKDRDKHVKIVYLMREDNEVVVINDYSYYQIQANMNIEHIELKRPALLFEDHMAINFFNVITRGLFIDDYEMIEGGNAGFLGNLASMKEIRQRLEAVIVLDADQRGIESKRVITLPGSYCIEKEMYAFLKGLSDKDSWWDKTTMFTRQLVLRDHQYDLSDPSTKDYYKTWFNEMIKKYPKRFGETGELLFAKWCQENKDRCSEFCEKLIEEVQSVLPTAVEPQKIGAELEAFYVAHPEPNLPDGELFVRNWSDY